MGSPDFFQGLAIRGQREGVQDALPRRLLANRQIWGSDFLGSDQHCRIKSPYVPCAGGQRHTGEVQAFLAAYPVSYIVNGVDWRAPDPAGSMAAVRRIPFGFKGFRYVGD